MGEIVKIDLTPISDLEVFLEFDSDEILVGRLAIKQREIFFEYADSFFTHNYHLSPIHLPLKKELFSFNSQAFNSLAGVFNDSLPDGWGRLLLDRHLRSYGLNPGNLTALDRLSHVGTSGMGALVYRPARNAKYPDSELIRIEDLANSSRAILEGSTEDVIEELLALNGSSAGARPKVCVNISSDKKSISTSDSQLSNNFSPWIVKFPNSNDGEDAGAIEYVYALMAKDAGVEMSDSFLFSSKQTAGYFATERFDRIANTRLHLHSAAGLLHADFRVPTLDYYDLLKLSFTLCKNQEDKEKMYRQAVFNVLSHNKDDHGKNFSFLMTNTGRWRLAPAYDLTFSSGPGGEQSTMVLQEGKSPGTSNLKQLAEKSALDSTLAIQIIEQTKDALSQWPQLSKNFGISKSNILMITKALNPS